MISRRGRQTPVAVAPVAPPWAPVQLNTLVSSATCILAAQVAISGTQSNGVLTALTDLSGGGNNYTINNSPAYNMQGPNGWPSAILNGTNQNLTNALVLPAPGTTPTFILFTFKITTWTINRFVLGGTTGTVPSIAMVTSGPFIRAQDGIGGSGNNGANPGVWVRGEAYFSNSSSDYLLLGTTLVSGVNVGNLTGTGVQIGSNAGASFGAIEFADVLYFSALPTERSTRNGGNGAIDAGLAKMYSSAILL